jgi:hypothetical protein
VRAEKRERKVLARSSRKSRDLLFSAQTHSYLPAKSVIGMLCAWKLGDYSAVSVKFTHRATQGAVQMQIEIACRAIRRTHLMRLCAICKMVIW